MVAPSLYHKPSIKSIHTIVSSNTWDIFKNFVIAHSKFRCTVTGKTYFIKGNLSLPLIKYVLPVTVHLNLLRAITKFLKMSHVLELTIDVQ